MARSHLGRRPRTTASVAGEEAYSRRRRSSPPMTPVQRSPSYSPTSRTYSPSFPSVYYSPTSPYLSAEVAADAYYPRLPRLDDDNEDMIDNEGPGPEGQDNDEHHIHEEEEHERSEGDDYSYGSGGVNGVQIQHQHDEDDEIIEVPDISDGENGVEDEGEEALAPLPLPHDDVQGNAAAVGDNDDDDRPISAVFALAPAAPQQPPSPPVPSFSDYSSSVIQNVTVENSSVFDCSICYLPLKSPIFQCSVGHVVCSACHDKLGQATRCHVCRIPIPGSYFRCNAMEQVVGSIRVPCLHAAHGCAERLAYHDRDAHARTCVHKPCYCPGEGCGFASAVQATLLEHFAAVHGWPCNTETLGGSADVHLRKGINIVVVKDVAAGGGADDDQGATTTTTTEQQEFTLVLNVEQPAPVCNAITAFCIHPSNTGTVRLGVSYYRRWRRRDSALPSTYMQSSQLQVVRTDLSHGMPGPGSCFPLLVPRWSPSPGRDHGDDIRITVNYIRGTT